MESLFKRLCLIVCICCKPPVFLTVSIIAVIAYLITIVSKVILVNSIQIILQLNLNDPVILLMSFAVAFGAAWLIFFILLAQYEIVSELNSLMQLFQNSQRGLRCVPVTLLHLFTVIWFEMISFQMVNHAFPKNQTLGLPQVFVSISHPEQERYHAVLIYTLWLAALIYSFFYFTIEMLFTYLFCNSSVVEIIHMTFVRAFVRITGIDLSDNPAGESPDNPLERHLLEYPRRQQVSRPPALGEYAHQQSNSRNKASNGTRRYISWNTLR